MTVDGGADAASVDGDRDASAEPWSPAPMPSRDRAPRTPSREAILAALAEDDAASGDPGPFTLHLFDELPSTSRWLEERAVARTDDAAHGAPPVLCTVDLQSAGHGRRGKRWVSRPGNVAVSLLEHLPLGLDALGGLSLVTGIAVAETLVASTGLDVRVKWPNDLLVGGAKLGGLLTGVQICDAGGAGAPCTRVVTGIGLNVVHDPRIAALGIGGTSLAAAGAGAIDRDRLVGLVAARVRLAHHRFAASGWAAFADAWEPLDALAGHVVEVSLGGESVRGRALGVDANGALRVDVDGVERNFHGGEVSVRTSDTATARGTAT